MRRAMINCAFWAILLSLALAAGVANADIETGLLGHWTFDEGEGTVAEDSSGNGIDGTFVGDPLWIEAGKIRGALYVDGTDDYVETNYTTDLSTWTVSTWVTSPGAPDATSPTGPVHREQNYQIDWNHSDATYQGAAALNVGGTWYAASFGTLAADTWYHLAATYDGENFRAYTDGVLVTDNETPSGNPSAETNSLKFGRHAAAAQFFEGTIDDVRVYDRALAEEDIVELYNWTGGANAGPDQRVETGTLVTLSGTGPGDATSVAWEQIITGDEPTVTLSDPGSLTTTFTPAVREIGYILTFRLTVNSPTSGISSDECLVAATAPNAPRLIPQNFQTYPGHLSYRLEWDVLVDADQYGVGFKIGTGYFWFWTADPYYDLLNLEEGLATIVAVKARNSYGDGPLSEDIALVPMRNYALPATLGGTQPPDDYVYVVSHYTISSMNDKIIQDDNNDSWDQGIYKTEDYWGCLWPQPILMDHVVYYTGNMFGDGGWFTDLRVQYTKDGTEWLDVPTTIVPPYSFEDMRQGRQTYQRFDMDIPALLGTGIRISGTPGGTATFTSIAELEVMADHVTARPLVVQGVDAEVPERSTGTIDASFSFSTRGDITSMLYEQISGPSVTITVTGDPLIATFEAPGVDADTELGFQLTGSDGTETLTDEVTITVKNLVTTAVSGPDQGVVEGSEVTLDGSGSLSTTGTLTYQWTQTSGDPVTLNNANTATASFDAPVIWGYTEELTFRLDVDDGAAGTSSDETLVTIQNALAYQAWPYMDVAAATTGYMTDVLHLGHNATDRVLAPLNINADQLAKWGGEANVRPVPGELYDFTDTGVTVTRNPMRWTPLHDDQGHFGEEGLDNFQQYYHVNIISPDERAATLHFMHDDEVRFWSNGVLIASRDGWDNDIEQTENFTLYEGTNAITVKFEEGGGGNRLRFGIKDEFGELMSDLYVAAGPSFVLADAYAVRELPTSYQPGGNIGVELSVRVDPANKPSNVTISEPIPAGLTVVDNGGGTQIGNSLSWSFSGTSVATQVLSYTLGVPGGVTGSLNFPGIIAFSGTTDTIKGDDVIYETPSAPQNLDVQMLLAANLSWSPSPEEGVVGYRVYRSVNGGDWEEIAFVATNSYKDLDVASGNSYDYQVAAVNADGVEGPLSDESGGKAIKMLVREAEDFNYGGGLYPGPGPAEVPAVKAPALDDFGSGYDFFFQSTDYPSPNVYRPKDDVDVWESNPGQFIIGYTSVGDWWRYTFDVPAPGASDPVGGWVKIILKVASPGGGAVDVYWDEAIVGSVPFVTGSWGNFDTYVVEDPLQTTVGTHTLRVMKTAGEMDIDTIGMGFNWTKPTREDLFADDFEDYTTLYSYDDFVAAGYTVNNGSGVADGAWRLWNTAGNWLNNEDPALDAMTNNYAITDSDLAGAVDADEELITPSLDCTEYKQVRLDFNMNYRAYIEDLDHLQIAEVDVRSSDDGVTWGNWVSLLQWDTSTVAETASGLEQVDLSAHADGKFIQVRWHFYEANYDYWFAVDDIRISGDKMPPAKGEILSLGYVEGVADLTWSDFGSGNYTLEYTSDLTADNWQPVPGTTWPISEMSWSGDISGILGQGVYLRVRSE